MPNRFVRNPVSNMYALSDVVFGGPALCTRGVRKHWFLKVPALRWVGAFAACFRWVPHASLVSSSVSCLLAAVGCSGLVKATKLVHRQRLPTPPGVYHIYFSIQCIDISLGHTHFSPSSLWCTHPGFLRDTPSIPQFSLAHPPWGSNPRPQG